LKRLQRGCPHALGWRVWSDELGILRLEVQKAPHHPVVFDVGDLRIVQDIVAIIVVVQGLSELRDFLFDRFRNHRGLPIKVSKIL